MPSSTLSHKFLLDENVRIELYRFLTQKKFDVKFVTKSASDSQIAVVSRKQRRILVTNDKDFTKHSENEIFSVIWLKIPQYDVESLIVSFERLLMKLKSFKGKLVILTAKDWEESSLVREEKL